MQCEAPYGDKDTGDSAERVESNVVAVAMEPVESVKFSRRRDVIDDFFLLSTQYSVIISFLDFFFSGDLL